MPYQFLADAVLVLHAGVVLFVVAGLPLVIAGNLRGWRWVNRRWLRLLHLAAILFIAAESWWGAACPLTTLELRLRLQARAGAYRGGFIEHWLERLLYWDAPAWMFVAAYTLFALAVAAAWWAWPPRPRRGEPP